MADGNVAMRAKGQVGRPRKARGAANSSDAADARWTVRGVPMNVRAMATKAAENRDMTVGDWLAEAVVTYARSTKAGVAADGSVVSADGGVNLPAVPMGEELAKVLTDIQTRLGKMEAERQKPWLNRIFGRHS